MTLELLRPRIRQANEASRRIRQAAESLTPSEEASLGVELLRDIQDVLYAEGCDRITSIGLTEKLCALPDRPWSEVGRGGKPLTQRRLARLLRPFDVTPGTARFGPKIARGYDREDFDESFERYLPHPARGSQDLTATPPQPNAFGALDDNSSTTPDRHVADAVPPNSAELRGRCGVAVREERTGLLEQQSLFSSDREVF